MTRIFLSRFSVYVVVCALVVSAHAAFGGTVNIASPRPNSTVSGAVPISASTNDGGPLHLEIWDNGNKVGDYFSNNVNIAPAFPPGQHTTTVLAVSNSGNVLDQSTVKYNVTGQPAPKPSPNPAPNPPPASGGVNIASPTSGSTSINAVRIAASANINASFHLDIWDNGYKLGEVYAGSVSGVYVLPNGSHVLTVQAINNGNGSMISESTVNYNVAENCNNSSNAECNLDQIGIDNSQNDCNPREEPVWVANPCGGGVQGANPVDPRSTQIQGTGEGNSIPDQGNLTLNGHSLHLLEVQGGNPSNVLFRGQSPATTPGNSEDSHWTLDTYVHLPDPNAHQAFELDAQTSTRGIWTKFYTECAFNMQNGTGYWGVFDSETGGWIFLNGKSQNGQNTPVVPCDRKQFAQPWSGSGNPGFTGWHHIAWSFLRNSDGTVTFQSLTFDGTTTNINFRPNSRNGGNVSNDGTFSALIQLDGVANGDRQHDVVDAYISEVNLIHTP